MNYIKYRCKVGKTGLELYEMQTARWRVVINICTLCLNAHMWTLYRREPLTWSSTLTYAYRYVTPMPNNDATVKLRDCRNIFSKVLRVVRYLRTVVPHSMRQLAATCVLSVGQQFVWLNTLIGYDTFGCKKWCPKVAYVTGEFRDFYDMIACKYINIYASKSCKPHSEVKRASLLCRPYFTKLCDSDLLHALSLQHITGFVCRNCNFFTNCLVPVFTTIWLLYIINEKAHSCQGECL